MKICGITKPKKYDAIAKMLRNGGSRNEISRSLRVGKDVVRLVDLMVRAKGGDKNARAELVEAHELRRKHNGFGKRRNYGVEIKDVDQYRCPECGQMSIYRPCLACLTRHNSVPSLLPPLREESEPLQCELEPEQEARRAELLSMKRGMGCESSFTGCVREDAGGGEHTYLTVS